MEKFTEEQLMRQDFVDNQIYDLVKRLIPSTREIEWNIEMIADIRDTIQYWLVDRYKVVEELEFYP
jgi:hypothetical protein